LASLAWPSASKARDLRPTGPADTKNNALGTPAGIEPFVATACLAVLDNGTVSRPLLSMSAAPLHQLQAFLTVARHQSFSGAARELGVSRSAISQTVQQLEEHLRVVLLVRTTRSVSVTDAGRRLVESAGPSLGQVVAALAEVSAQPGETVGRVRLSVPRAAVPCVIDPVLPKFRERHPRIVVETVIEDRFVDIVAERYDAGVRLSEASVRYAPRAPGFFLYFPSVARRLWCARRVLATQYRETLSVFVGF
jgi:DNA-binding transcriptional LysR family regulator